MKNHWLAALTLALLVAVGFFWQRGKMLNYIIVENRSGLAIISLEIQVCGNPHFLATIDPGEYCWAQFHISNDDHFEVTGRLRDGTAFSGSHGYVSSGMTGVRASFKIEKGGHIVFDQN